MVKYRVSPDLGAEFLMAWLASGSTGDCCQRLELEFWLCLWPLVWPEISVAQDTVLASGGVGGSSQMCEQGYRDKRRRMG